jgi:hypothetical protein
MKRALSFPIARWNLRAKSFQKYFFLLVKFFHVGNDVRTALSPRSPSRTSPNGSMAQLYSIDLRPGPHFGTSEAVCLEEILWYTSIDKRLRGTRGIRWLGLILEKPPRWVVVRSSSRIYSSSGAFEERLLGVWKVSYPKTSRRLREDDGVQGRSVANLYLVQSRESVILSARSSAG